MNAIIIAAGMGTRLRPLTLSIPKPLIKIFDKPMIERNIEFLLERGLKEIIIVTGYLAEQFSYLEEKYPEVKLIYNDKFNEYNNIYSFYLIRNYLEDSYILEGDIILNKNIFSKNLKESVCFSKKILSFNNEWQLITDKNNFIKEIRISGKNNYIISGPRFFIKRDSEKLKMLVEKYCENEKIKKEYFWDNILKENIDLFKIKVIEMQESDIYEVDTLEELINLDSSYKEFMIKGERK
jgi:CTP:phosphocholine cytidylyltransferase-like protein